MVRDPESDATLPAPTTHPGPAGHPFLPMSDEITLSQEQADLIEQAVPAALETVLGGGELVPTLYTHAGNEITVETLPIESQEALHAAVRAELTERFPEVLSYLLVYDATIETPEGMTEALILETGDSGDDVAHELARGYSRETGEADPDLVRLGDAARLFLPA